MWGVRKPPAAVRNRKFGPAIVMELAEQRAPRGFDNIEDVITRRELEDLRFLTRSTRDSKAGAQATGPICVKESGAASYRQGSIRRHSIGGVEAGRAFVLSGNPAAVVAAQFTFRVGPTWRLTRIAALNAFLATGDLLLDITGATGAIATSNFI